ncbi:unnamed protein product [Didymodactylos carnosus]|uniref:Uncharacterized protein n=1 Tax=Didymodactylos carnosus TaxID=1234261 RepID=A0A815MQA7_9BILA|nr:unnamed protein product [Didymodactylos carnosus]CAF1424604.1 unnamed protein product [Didymodactylos carnosus]CAF4049732.1 unnamed protein product [Didymodactylos carnosus]CAF4305857.1 unnamed protein product [Didymodactylos carnosus]
MSHRVCGKKMAPNSIRKFLKDNKLELETRGQVSIKLTKEKTSVDYKKNGVNSTQHHTKTHIDLGEDSKQVRKAKVPGALKSLLSVVIAKTNKPEKRTTTTQRDRKRKRLRRR